MSETAIESAARVLQRLCSLAALGGLCIAAQANTTAVLPSAAPAATLSDPARLRVGVLLPLKSTALKSAAEMVRDGFLAAYERDGSHVDVTVIETDDVAGNVVTAYVEAAPRHDVIVGPLSRSAVTALAAGTRVSRPTIALTQPEAGASVEPRLPARMLVIGLSIEEEARQAAAWALREHGGSKALIVSTGVAWQKRAARAFVSHWQKNGAEVDVMELSVSGGALDASALAQVKKRLQGDPPTLILAALDAPQTRQLRRAVGLDLPMYGTSQLNPMNLSEQPDVNLNAEQHAELDGVRLVDMPWQLQADHPAVMIYPHPVKIGELRRSPDLERLYALGIDAYRVATEIGGGQRSFVIDGVTGKLSVRFDGIAESVFQRSAQPAIYQAGAVRPIGADR